MTSPQAAAKGAQIGAYSGDGREGERDQGKEGEKVGCQERGLGHRACGLGERVVRGQKQASDLRARKGGREAGRQGGREGSRQTGRQGDRNGGRETERQRDREVGRDVGGRRAVGEGARERRCCGPARRAARVCGEWCILACPAPRGVIRQGGGHCRAASMRTVRRTRTRPTRSAESNAATQRAPMARGLERKDLNHLKKRCKN